VPTFLFAQETAPMTNTIKSAGEKRAKVSIEGGYYIANDYNKVIPGENFSFEMSYMLDGKFSLISHSNFGRTRYFEDELSNAPYENIREDSTNADILTIHYGLCVGYTTPISKKATITFSTGISPYSETIRYPSIVAEGVNLFSVYQQKTQTLITVPLKASIQVLVSDSFELGLAGGIYFTPGEAIIGKHFGPQATFKF